MGPSLSESLELCREKERSIFISFPFEFVIKFAPIFCHVVIHRTFIGEFNTVLHDSLNRVKAIEEHLLIFKEPKNKKASKNSSPGGPSSHLAWLILFPIVEWIIHIRLL
jgi:hypothetical protein